MTSTLFLASSNLGGLAAALPGAPADLRTVFVPTAGSIYDAAPWVDEHRAWFRRSGFSPVELELASASRQQVSEALSEADFVYVAGGNTYFLLHHLQRTGFGAALAASAAVYAGSSAGAIVACHDIQYIEDLDDRSAVPELESTRGLGLVDVRIMPHMDDPHFRPTIDRILPRVPSDLPLVVLDDDQAMLVRDGRWSVVGSPDVVLEG